MDFEYCGTYPRIWWWKGGLWLIHDFLKNATHLVNNRQPDYETARGFVMAANSALRSFADQTDHCDAKAAFIEGVAATDAVLVALDGDANGTVDKGTVLDALRFSISIVIKIGKITITISW